MIREETDCMKNQLLESLAIVSLHGLNVYALDNRGGTIKYE